MLTFLYRMLCTVALVVVAVLAGTVNAHAQKVGEWIAIDSIHQGRINTSQRDIKSAGQGNYIVMVQEDVSIGPFMIRHTTDAGATWNIVRADSGFKWRLTDIAYPAPDRMVAIGDTATQVSGDNYMLHPFVLHSQDAGKTWGRTQLLDGVYISSLSMYDELHGAILGAHSDSSNQLEYLIFTTTDGGITWKTLYPEANGSYLSNIVCLSPSRIGVLGYNVQTGASVFIRTDDGGENWGSYPCSSAIVALEFLDSLNGWGVGGNSTGTGDTRRDFIAHTTDGGSTWAVVLDEAIDFRFGLSGVDFADEMHGIAVGSYGKILRTSDGGATWIQDWPAARLVAEYVGFGSVAYPTPDEAIATSGGTGYLIKYTGRQKLPAPKITEPSTNLAELPLNLTVRWTAIQDAEWYDLQVADTTYEYNYVNHHVFDVPYIDASSLTVTEKTIQLDPHTRYVFRVRARNTTDTSDWSIYIYTISRDAGKVLSAPVFITPENGATNVPQSVTITWSGVDGATGYDLMVSDNPAYLGTPVVNESDIQGTSYSTSALKPATTYFARVRARNATEVGNWSSLNSGNHQFTTSSTSSVGPAATTEQTLLTIVPNPVLGGKAALTVRIERKGIYRIVLVNAVGQEIQMLDGGQFEPGTKLVSLDLSSIAAGNYFIRMIGEERSSLPVVLVR